MLGFIFEQYRKEFEYKLYKSKTLLESYRIYDAGQTLELAIKDFYLSILPEYIGITRGFVFDTNGEKHSKEID